MVTPVLISFAGLPGTGKTTIARALAKEARLPYVRVDEIETALKPYTGGKDLGPEGYVVAAALAASNLELGQSVIVDCVNPLPETRNMFLEAAKRGKGRLLGVEIFCSVPEEHKRRVEQRQPDIPDHIMPSWQEILNREYTPWNDAKVRVDTARLITQNAVERILQELK